MRAAVTDLNVDRLVTGTSFARRPCRFDLEKMNHGDGAGAYESSNCASNRGLVMFGL